MKKYYQLEPEVSGEIGDKTIFSQNPLQIKELEFVFKGWLGDCLIECFPIYLITQKVVSKFVEKKITGYTINDVKVKTAYPFNELYSDIKLPPFTWLNITGTAYKDDFGIENKMLVVSERLLTILKDEGIKNCDIMLL
jgi:hypothetical protein